MNQRVHEAPLIHDKLQEEPENKTVKKAFRRAAYKAYKEDKETVTLLVNMLESSLGLERRTKQKLSLSSSQSSLDSSKKQSSSSQAPISASSTNSDLASVLHSPRRSSALTSNPLESQLGLKRNSISTLTTTENFPDEKLPNTSSEDSSEEQTIKPKNSR